MKPIEQFEKNGLTVKIYVDEDATSPREYDNLGTLVCFHRRYNLGDAKHGFKDAEAVMEHIKSTDAVFWPVYLHDHGSLALSVSDFGDRWDSGQIGVIFATREAILKEYGVKRMTKTLRLKVLTQLRLEVQSMHEYVSGEVYGIVIEDRDGEHLDSCWGFHGADYAREEAERMLMDAMETVNREVTERVYWEARGVVSL